MNHPLKVYFPQPGKYLLLHWWTYSDRGHLILAKSYDSLVTTARRAFFENVSTQDDLEIKSLSLVEMVAPPLGMCQRAEEHAHQEKVKNFLREICFKLKSAMDDGAELPEGFVKCHEFCSEYGDSDPDQDELENHYSCSNCFGRVRLEFTIDPEKFYQQHHQAWYQENPPKNYIDPKAIYSRAKPAGENEDLWVALPIFGHHSAGADLYPLEKDRYDSVLFYYRKLEDLDASARREALQVMLNQIQSEYREEIKQKEVMRRAKRDLEEQQERNKVLQFFRKV